MKKNAFRIILGFILLLAIPLSSFATTDHFSVLSQQSPFQPGDLLTNLGSDNLLKNQWQLWAEFDYLHHPLELTRGGVTVGGIVDRLFVQHFGGSWAPTDWWNLEMDFPLVYKVEYREPTIPIARDASSKFTLGDIFVRQRFTILRRTDYPVGLTLNPYITAPTGNASYYVADKKPTGGLVISIDRDFGKYFSAVINTGAETGERLNLYDLNIRHRLIAGGGFAIKPTPHWNIKAEVASKTDLEHPFQDKLRSPTELLFGTDVDVLKGLRLGATGGLSLIRGYDTPLFRMMAGMSYTSPRPYRAPREKKPKIKIVEPEPTTLSQPQIVMDESMIRGIINTTEPIHFPFNSITLSAKDKATLNKLSDFLLEHPEIKEIEIIGHSDLKGSARANESISLKRAEAVMRQLELRGIPEELILTPLGVSADSPVGNNTTDEGRSQNRRVEFHFSH